jgi:hypothetical protein
LKSQDWAKRTPQKRRGTRALRNGKLSLRFSKILTSFNISVWSNLFDKSYSGVRVIRSVQLHGFRLNSVLWFPHVRFVFSPNLFYRGINFVFIYVPWSGTWFYTRCWWCRLTITGPVPPVKQALLTIPKRPGSLFTLGSKWCYRSGQSIL